MAGLAIIAHAECCGQFAAPQSGAARDSLNMRKSLWLILTVVFLPVWPPAASADAVVTINFSETTFINSTTAGNVTDVPLTFETDHEILSIAILWADTGTANFPFPLVYGAEDNVVLDDGAVSSVCNYLYQSGPSSYYAVDCPTGTLEAPYVSSVTYAGNWGSATIGFAGSEPITINSTLTQQTIVPEPRSLSLAGLGLIGLMMVGMRKRMSRSHPHAT